MNPILGFVTGLLTAALSLLGFVQQHPELPQTQRDQAQQVATQAISQASQTLSAQVITEAELQAGYYSCNRCEKKQGTPDSWRSDSGAGQTIWYNPAGNAIGYPSGNKTSGSVSANAENGYSGTFSATPASGASPLAVTFADTILKTTANGGGYIEYGDGTNCASDAGCGMYKHTYASAGTYTAVLYARMPSVEVARLTITVTGGTSGSTAISVPGMSKYTDADFGFSFWYPSGWTVKQVSIEDPNYFQGGTVVRQLTVAMGGGIEMTIKEFTSPQRSIGVPAGACFTCWAVTYYFDANNHEWMQQYPRGMLGNPVATQEQVDRTKMPAAADVSNNTMGGLHIFLGNDYRFGSSIIPLSARNFVYVQADGLRQERNDIPLARTIVATDPDVATPVSAQEQVKVIQAEKDAYAGQ